MLRHLLRVPLSRPITTSQVVWLMTVIVLQMACAESLPAQQNNRPNLVIIMADDLGYGGVSCYGDPGYQTPHIDRLAREGLRFTDFHSSGAVCSPTRAGLLTGRYQQRAGVDGVIFADPQQNRHHGLQHSETTFAELLSEAGYAIGIFGKWHLGYAPTFNPVHQGFDAFRGYVSGNVCYVSHLDRMGIEDWWNDDALTPEEGYVTHLVTKHSVDFIEAHKDAPFCLYVPHECVHSPFQGPDDPPVRKEGRVGEIKANQRKDVEAAYAEMMIEMDKGIGEIVATLDRLKLSERTLVFFFSDNGAMQKGSNGDLRGFKGSLWEGGHRVPAIARWPGHIEPGVTDQTAISIDLMPTMLELAGVEPPADLALDGVSLARLLTQGEPLPQRHIYWAYRNKLAMRDGPWKLITGEKGMKDAGLFNLEQDIAEQHNLAGQQPQRVASMQAELRKWRKEIATGATEQPDRPSTALDADPAPAKRGGS